MCIFFLPSVSVANLAALPPCAGVYYVTAVWLVFYVGKSKNLRRRWQSHHRYQEAKALHPFGKIHYLVTSPDRLDRLEISEIRRLKPTWNRKTPLNVIAKLRLAMLIGLRVAGLVAIGIITIILLVKILLFYI